MTRFDPTRELLTTTKQAPPEQSCADDPDLENSQTDADDGRRHVMGSAGAVHATHVVLAREAMGHRYGKPKRDDGAEDS